MPLAKIAVVRETHAEGEDVEHDVQRDGKIPDVKIDRKGHDLILAAGKTERHGDAIRSAVLGEGSSDCRGEVPSGQSSCYPDRMKKVGFALLLAAAGSSMTLTILFGMMFWKELSSWLMIVVGLRVVALF